MINTQKNKLSQEHPLPKKKKLLISLFKKQQTNTNSRKVVYFLIKNKRFSLAA
jgi:F0F1-type ATP synthase delta subunit